MTIPATTTGIKTGTAPQATRVAQKGRRAKASKSNTVVVHGCQIQRGSKTPSTIPSLKCQVKRFSKTSSAYRRIASLKATRRRPQGATRMTARRIKISLNGRTQGLRLGNSVTLPTDRLNMGPTFQMANVARCMINGFYKKGNKVYVQVMVKALIKGTQEITHPARFVPFDIVSPRLRWHMISQTKI